VTDSHNLRLTFYLLFTFLEPLFGLSLVFSESLAIACDLSVVFPEGSTQPVSQSFALVGIARASDPLVDSLLVFPQLLIVLLPVLPESGAECLVVHLEPLFDLHPASQFCHDAS